MTGTFRTSSTIPMTASEVRARVLEEHRRLRTLLVQTQGLARAAALEATAVPSLRASTRTLLLELSLHLDSEEEILMPLIAELPGYGDVLVAQMREEHAEQRRELRALHERTMRNDVEGTLPEAVDDFVLRLFRDMRAEERCLLDENVLRDDVIVIDKFCG